MEYESEDRTLVERQDEAYTKITAFLDGYMDEHNGHMFLFEFGTFMYVMLWKMRQSLTFDKLVRYMTGMLNVTEFGIQRTKEEHGDDMIIAEDWEGVEGGEEMLRDIAKIASDTGELHVPDNWLEEE